MFEPTFRLIAHVASFSVLQSSGPHGTRLVRYRILDEGDLLAEPILQWIEAGVPTEERADCRRTILLVVRCRDAFAHGTIVTFDDATRKAYGALLTKALYLLLTAVRGQGV